MACASFQILAPTAVFAQDTAKTQAVASTPAPAQSLEAPEAAPDNIELSLREVHETLRRMKGCTDDILHEVSRTQQVYNNGVPVTTSPWQLNPAYMAMNMTAQDALSHNVYLPPRAHWLDNSLAQLRDLQSRLKAETANLSKLLQNPVCNSATRSQGFVMGDITLELAKDLDNLSALTKATPPSNAQINVATHKIIETISGLDKVGDRLWKEAPRGLKNK